MSRAAGPAASRVTQIVDGIRQMIVEQKLVPGMRLPAERQLASEFRAGRPAVREAIRALTMLGFVESRDRDGTYLKSPATADRVLSRALRRSSELTAHTTPDVAAIVRQHRTIFDAIRLGQSDLAERAMADHLETVGLDLISERAR